MRTGPSILLLQTLAEFSSVAFRKAEDDDLSAARAGVLGCNVMGRGHNGPVFELAVVRFVNPFDAANNRLIDEVMPPE
jgi:hypothetical protein